MNRIILLAFALFPAVSFTQITLYDVYPDSQMVDGLIGGGHQSFNVNYFGHSKSIAGFDLNHSTIQMNRGILMSTGFADSSSQGPGGPNQTTDFGTDMNFPGSSVIEDYHGQGTTSYDAAILSFDFIAGSASLEMEVVFASEEYHDFVASGFGDAAVVLISGPGINGVQNIAVVPNTTSVIGVNQINNGQNNNGPCQNCSYFEQNSFNDLHLKYNAHTKAIPLERELQIGQTYEVTIIIADFTDANYDSGFFISGCNTCALGESELSKNEYVVYPNPAHESFTITGSFTESMTYELIDLNGKSVTSGGLSVAQNTIEVSAYEAGTYILLIRGASGTMERTIVKIQ